MTPRKKRPPTRESEAQFQAAVIQYATLRGWLHYHIYDSRKVTSPGFPDLCLVRGGQIIFLELKTERGRVRPEQRVWLDALRQCNGVAALVARPSDWPKLEELLR